MSGSLLAQTAQKPNLQMKKFPMDQKFEESHTQATVNNTNRVVIASDDFSNAGNWAIATTGQGTWQIVTTMPAQQGSYMGNMASTTAANGFGTFNGVQYLIAGSCDPQNTTLTYNTAIDVSAYTAITVDFEQRYRAFNTDHTYIEVSDDNGANWTTFEINTQYPVNTSPVPQGPVSLNVSSAITNFATTTQMMVRFRWEETTGDDQYGSGYGWCVDDFSVNTAPNDNLVLVGSRAYDPNSITTWGDEIGYTFMPTSQVTSVAFAGQIDNQGAGAQTNVRVTADVSNSVPTVVFNGTGAGAPLASGATLYDQTTAGYTPPATVETYTAAITANYDNLGTDATPTDNAGTASFRVTADEWARDDNTYTGSGIWNGAGNGYVVGPVFEVQTNTAVNRVRAAFTGSTAVGVVACAQIYTVDGTGAFVLVADECGTANEITLTAAQISSAAPIKWVDFVICANLTAGEFYFPAIQHYGGADDLVIMAGGNADTATVFLLDGTDATWYYTLSIPKIRFVEGACDNAVGDLEDKGFVLSQNMPNPANNTTTIFYSMPSEGDVNFEIVDITGKIVERTEIGNKGAGEYKLVLDASHFSNGVYFYSMTINGQKITRRMVISK